MTKTCVERRHLSNQYKTWSHFKSLWASAAFEWTPFDLSLTLVRGEPLNWGPQKLAPKKLEESLYRTALIYWLRIIAFCHSLRVWQTDGRTDRRRQQVRSNRVRCALKTKGHVFYGSRCRATLAMRSLHSSLHDGTLSAVRLAGCYDVLWALILWVRTP